MKVDKVFMDLTEIMFPETLWGCRLAWSRLVDLGSIDSGSNPGSPTTLSDDSKLFSELHGENCVIELFKLFSNVLLKLRPNSFDFSISSLSKYNTTFLLFDIASSPKGACGGEELFYMFGHFLFSKILTKRRKEILKKYLFCKIEFRKSIMNSRNRRVGMLLRTKIYPFWSKEHVLQQNASLLAI